MPTPRASPYQREPTTNINKAEAVVLYAGPFLQTSAEKFRNYNNITKYLPALDKIDPAVGIRTIWPFPQVIKLGWYRKSNCTILDQENNSQLEKYTGRRVTP